MKSTHKNKTINQLTRDQKNTLVIAQRTMKQIEKHLPWRPKCYNRALTAKSILARRGIKTTLHIGFLKEHNNHLGHAWLTHEKFIVSGKLKQLNTYKILKTMDSAPSTKLSPEL